MKLILDNLQKLVVANGRLVVAIGGGLPTDVGGLSTDGGVVMGLCVVSVYICIYMYGREEGRKGSSGGVVMEAGGDWLAVESSLSSSPLGFSSLSLSQFFLSFSSMQKSETKKKTNDN